MDTLSRLLCVFSVFFFTTLNSIASEGEAPSKSSLLSIDEVVSRYGNLPRTSMMSVSPNGEMVAFRKTQDDKDIVVVYSLTKRKMLSGLNVADIQPQYIHFLNDQYLILVASEHRRMIGFRGAWDVSSAFALNVESGEIEQLLRPGDEIYKGQSGLGRILGVSRDHKYLYMPAFVARSAGDRSPDYSLMRVNISSPRSPRVVVRGSGHTIDYFLGYDGEVLAQEVYNNKENLHQIKVPQSSGRGWQTIFEMEVAVREVGFVGLTEDHKSLVLMRNNDTTGRTDYYTMSLQDGKISNEALGNAQADVEGVITDANRIVRGVVYAGFRPSYEIYEPEHQALLDSVKAKFPDQHVSLVDWADNWTRLIVKVEGLNTAGSYYLASANGELQFLADRYSNIAEDQVHPTMVHTFKADDGLAIPTLLTLPLSRAHAPKSLPTVILPHGGPAAYDENRFDWLAQSFAARGYLVLQPQFRGSLGFGTAHYVAGHGEWGRKMQDDVTQTVQFFSKVGLVDPTRVCIVGASYGGYAALAGAAFTPDVYRCAVSINGVADVERLLDDKRSSHGSDHSVVSYFELSALNGEYSDEDLKAISPLHAAASVVAPVLLVHGENDDVVSIKQSRAMESALEDAGKKVRFVTLEDENHYLLEGETRTLALREVLDFLDQNLPVEP